MWIFCNVNKDEWGFEVPGVILLMRVCIIFYTYFYKIGHKFFTHCARFIPSVLFI